MFIKNRKAFTLIELVFVIVVIGILSAIAIPKFAGIADSAYLTKAQDTLATVRNALMTERQKRILRGNFTSISDLSLTDSGAQSPYVFDRFSSDGRTPAVYISLFEYPIEGCASATQRACWKKISSNPAIYAYRFSNVGTGNDGQAEFLIDKNKFKCNSGDESDCKLLTQ
jgi:general secretion pathway protein G